MTEPQETYFDTRWACRSCGRFIPEASIRSWDVLDPGEYYGVRGEIRGMCGRHGEVEPACVPTRELPLPRANRSGAA